MLTLVEAISLAGDRAKQNDDAYGLLGARAWVLDGATDLDDLPLTRTASDASWIAHRANAFLHAASGALRDQVRHASAQTAATFRLTVGDARYDRWRSPISSLLMIEDTDVDIRCIDLGDSRVFGVDASGAVFVAGGPDDAADDETALAARQTDRDKPLLSRTDTIAMLRRMRGELNQPGSRWTFCLDPACADHARVSSWAPIRPAHMLLMTDGFSALADRYRAYRAADLVGAALDTGLQDLGRELRAIEQADASGAIHPRFKQSDDATALLVRLT